MSGGRRRRNRDLGAVAAFAIVATAATILTLPSPVRAAVLVPFVLAVPGYALAAALFPPGTLSRGERLVHAFVLSIATVAIGGVVVQLVLDLHRTALILIDLSVTLAGTAVALRRRATQPIQRSAPPARFGLPVGAVGALGFLAAAVIAVAAVVSASHGVREQQARQVFASLWAVPDRSDPGRLRVGVSSHAAAGPLSLRVSRGETVLAELPVRLAHGASWEATLPAAVAADTPDLLVTLLRDGAPYRSVELNPGEPG